MLTTTLCYHSVYVLLFVYTKLYMLQYARLIRATIYTVNAVSEKSSVRCVLIGRHTAEDTRSRHSSGVRTSRIGASQCHGCLGFLIYVHASGREPERSHACACVFV
jgi:hypothetical protein